MHGCAYQDELTKTFYLSLCLTRWYVQIFEIGNKGPSDFSGSQLSSAAAWLKDSPLSQIILHQGAR
jgi:hypothetical protein